MNLLIKRIAKRDNYTIGKLYIDGVYFCDTLEDKDRGLTQSMQLSQISKIKVYGSTAIPTGTYIVNMGIVSPKFKTRKWAIPYDGKIPRLQNVNGFDGVLIHPGSSNKDTYGCLLVGKNTLIGKLTESQNTFHKLMKILSKNKDIIITIQ